MYTLYKFHFLNRINEINQLFDDILIIWPAPVYIHAYIHTYEGGSEFSGAWCKRGEGGQGREGVQLPDSLMYEAVLQSAGPRLETPQTEEAVCRVGGITCNAEGFAGETGAVNVLEGGERDTNDLLSCSHYPLKGLAAGRVAGAIPHSDAASQNALDGASVEGAHDGGRGSGSSEFAEDTSYKNIL